MAVLITHIGAVACRVDRCISSLDWAYVLGNLIHHDGGLSPVHQFGSDYSIPPDAGGVRVITTPTLRGYGQINVYRALNHLAQGKTNGIGFDPEEKKGRQIVPPHGQFGGSWA